MKSKQSMSVRALTANAVVMAIYVVLCFILPYQSGAIQFRLSESLNHLVVFNRKFIWGVFGGVILFNLFFGNGILDVIFGGGQTLIALAATIWVGKYVENKMILMICNIFFFTISMCLIALMLNLTLELPFWPTYATTALSELIIMTISAPVMYIVDRAVHFKDRI